MMMTTTLAGWCCCKDDIRSIDHVVCVRSFVQVASDERRLRAVAESIDADQKTKTKKRRTSWSHFVAIHIRRSMKKYQYGCRLHGPEWTSILSWCQTTRGLLKWEISPQSDVTHGCCCRHLAPAGHLPLFYCWTIDWPCDLNDLWLHNEITYLGAYIHVPRTARAPASDGWGNLPKFMRSVLSDGYLSTFGWDASLRWCSLCCRVNTCVLSEFV